MQEQQSNIKKTFSSVTVDSVGGHTQNEKKAAAGILNVQLRQQVTTTYPAMNIKGGLFDINEFNVSGQTYTSNRVTWVDAPAGTTIEKITELLAAKPNARIVAVFSNNVNDVLNEAQKAAIVSGLQTPEFFEDKLRVRGVNGEDLPEGPNGERQYRNYSFQPEGGNDVDLRTYKGGNNQSVTVEEQGQTAGRQSVI